MAFRHTVGLAAEWNIRSFGKIRQQLIEAQIKFGHGTFIEGDGALFAAIHDQPPKNYYFAFHSERCRAISSGLMSGRVTVKSSRNSFSRVKNDLSSSKEWSTF